MAKKQLTPFSKLLLSGILAVLLIGGALAAIFAVQQKQQLESQAYDAGRMRYVRPIATPVLGPQCFDRVIMSMGGYYWPDACRGRVTSGLCAQVLTKLTDEELAIYKKWVSLGKPSIPGCMTVATPRPSIKPGVTPYPGSVQY